MEHILCAKHFLEYNIFIVATFTTTPKCRYYFFHFIVQEMEAHEETGCSIVMLQLTIAHVSPGNNKMLV
jgi:hypothetical protein